MVGSTIDMQSMRYLNLFNNISRVRTKYCFKYNNALVFIVDPKKVSTAIGPGAKNAKLLSSKLGYKIKVIGSSEQPTKKAITDILTNLADQATITKVDLKEDNLTITAGRQTKATLIGRNRIREKELLVILKSLFGIKTIKFN